LVKKIEQREKSFTRVCQSVRMKAKFPAAAAAAAVATVVVAAAVAAVLVSTTRVCRVELCFTPCAVGCRWFSSRFFGLLTFVH
jgi:hypothetical protein